MNKTIIIKGLLFVMTCESFPEQYDVYDGRGRLVGYVRLRHGRLTCDYPSVTGREIYFATIGSDDYVGYFESDEQRMQHLEEIAIKIRQYIKKDKKKRDKRHGR